MDRTVSSVVGNGRCRGTFGELIQGALPPDGRDFLVTLPVGRWSHARFRSEPGEPLRVQPGDRTKSRALADRMLARYGLARGGLLTIESTLPVGKGMASSSADLIACARAIADAFELDLTPAAAEELLRGIEPADGVMYDAAVAFCHREVRLLLELGGLPPLTIVGMDEGGTVDTVAFNEVPKAYSTKEMSSYEAMLAEARDAVAAGDARTLGRLATRSAEMNQRLQSKRLLDDAVALSGEVGALGVVTAHSGTTLGVLLDDTDPDYESKLAQLWAACHRLSDSVSIDYSAP